jgi:hypothetical protein
MTGKRDAGRKDASPSGPPEATEGPQDEDELVDEMEEESFPASDPPSTWAGPPPAPDEA